MPKAGHRHHHAWRRTGETMGQEEPAVARWLQLIQAEYREMPDLSLSKTQMQRLWGFDPFVCDALVDALVAARVLRRTANGNYMTHGTMH
jgi:hypothetical protein